MSAIVKAICPDYTGEDRKIVGTMDKSLWYRVNRNERVLYTPPDLYLKKQVSEIDNFVASVRTFLSTPLEAPEYDWDESKMLLCHYNLLEIDHKYIVSILLNTKALLVDAHWVSCDIETSNVKWEGANLLAIGFGYSDTEAVSFTGITKDILPLFQQIFADKRIRFIWHNGKYDTTRLKYFTGLDARIDEDTMLLHYSRVNVRQGTHGLKHLAPIYLQAPAWEDTLDKYRATWCRENKVLLSEFRFDYLPTEILTKYHMLDCIATRRLYFKLLSMARPNSEKVYEMSMNLARVLKEVELTGFKVDIPYMEDLEWELEKRYNSAIAVQQQIATSYWNPERYTVETGAKTTPKELNLGSHKQLKWLIEQVLEYPILNTTAETLGQLSEEHPDIPFLKSVGETRALKIYLETFISGIKENLCRDGRIRTSFNIHGTETGRLSSSNPNMQNVPRNPEMRNLFCASKGYTLIDIDQSQVELRVLAIETEDPYLMQIFKDNANLHDRMAEGMFGAGYTQEQRQQAKTITFGIIYGRGPSAIAKEFGIDVFAAKKIISDWFKPVPKVQAWIYKRRRMAMNGDACVTTTGRARNFVITDENAYNVQNEYINTPIQSIASDLTLVAMCTLHDELVARKLDARIVSTTHDSIVIEVKDTPEAIEEVVNLAKKIMSETAPSLINTKGVPFFGEAKVGKAWGEVEKQ